MSDGDLFAIFDDKSKLDKDGILDSACAFHMCHNQDLFVTYEKISKYVMVMGNRATCRVVDICRFDLSYWMVDLEHLITFDMF